MMTNSRPLLRYLSHLVSAPIIATPVFVSLSILEHAQAVHVLVAVVFASMVPLLGIVYFAMFLVTLSWKISVHAAGVTGPLTFLVFKLGLPWSFLYLLVVPVGLLRLRLRQHTLLQVLAGAVLSAALTWAEIILLVPLIPFARS